ncbi:hypothetical protein HDV02_000025 [Globomyces sp. JEL0801]|nr:hypothetical protein HDV02_000025 [Globomyces sp. JEL0801]
MTKYTQAIEPKIKPQLKSKIEESWSEVGSTVNIPKYYSQESHNEELKSLYKTIHQNIQSVQPKVKKPAHTKIISSANRVVKPDKRPVVTMLDDTCPPAAEQSAHRRYLAVYPCASTLLAKKWDDATWTRHRDKIKSMRPAIDNKNPIASNPKSQHKTVDAREKEKQIERENEILLKRIARQRNLHPDGVGTVDKTSKKNKNKTNSTKFHPSSDFARKHQQAKEKIEKENQNKKPIYESKQWTLERQEHLKHLLIMTKYPEAYQKAKEREERLNKQQIPRSESLIFTKIEINDTIRQQSNSVVTNNIVMPLDIEDIEDDKESRGSDQGESVQHSIKESPMSGEINNVQNFVKESNDHGSSDGIHNQADHIIQKSNPNSTMQLRVKKVDSDQFSESDDSSAKDLCVTNGTNNYSYRQAASNNSVSKPVLVDMSEFEMYHESIDSSGAFNQTDQGSAFLSEVQLLGEKLLNITVQPETIVEEDKNSQLVSKPERVERSESSYKRAQPESITREDINHTVKNSFRNMVSSNPVSKPVVVDMSEFDMYHESIDSSTAFKPSDQGSAFLTEVQLLGEKLLTNLPVQPATVTEEDNVKYTPNNPMLSEDVNTHEQRRTTSNNFNTSLRSSHSLSKELNMAEQKTIPSYLENSWESISVTASKSNLQNGQTLQSSSSIDEWTTPSQAPIASEYGIDRNPNVVETNPDLNDTLDFFD